jgi:hypothetical protein
MKSLSNTVLLIATLSACALLSGQTFAEGVAMPGANLIAYHGVETTAGAGERVAVAMPGANLIAYRGVEKTSGAEATGAFCSITPAKNFNAGAIGLLSARTTSC